MDPVIAAGALTAISIGLVAAAATITHLKPPLYLFLVAAALSAIGWAYAPSFRGFYTPRIDVKILVNGEDYASRYLLGYFWSLTGILLVSAIIVGLIGVALLVIYGRRGR